MSDLNIQLCPETGICSIIKADGKKVDLMPGEVGDMKSANGDASVVKQTIAQADASFAAGLDDSELAQVIARLG